MRLIGYFYKKSTLPVVVISFLAFVLFMVLVLPSVSEYTEEVTSGASSPDTSFFYNATELFEMVEEYSPEARTSYVILRLTFDMIWPLAYSGFMISSLYFLMKKIENKKKVLLLLPVLPILLDYLENVLLSTIMVSYPTKLLFLGHIVSVVSALKWTSIGATYITIMLLLVLWVYKKYQKQAS